MKIRSFIVAYALVLALLLFADRRTGPKEDSRYSHVVDLTGSDALDKVSAKASPATRIISPAALIPGTWSAGQIPAERLIAPLVVMDLKADENSQITLNEIAEWEARQGVVPQGAVVAIRRASKPNAVRLANTTAPSASAGAQDVGAVATLPITSEAAQFLMDARYVLGFAVETRTDLALDRTLARQLALHGNYVVDGATRFSSLPATGSLVIVAPIKTKKAAEAPVRVLAMVK
jgi:kynurenine formamidase